MKLSFLTIFLSFQLLIAAPPPPAKPAPDSYKLVLVWPNTFCLLQQLHQCKRKPQTFTLHGFWPQAGGQSIMDCHDEYPGIDATFNLYKVDLNNYWPDLKHANFKQSKSFWKYEWKKHGSCSQMPPEKYLKIVFDKMKKYDVKGTLAKKGIIPAAYPKGYERQEFGEAIFNDKKLHVYTEIRCKWNQAGTKQYLHQITLCLDAQGDKFMNCSDEGTRINCTTDSLVTLPPLSVT